MSEFDVFLSHNSVDKPWVSRLKGNLLRYGVSVWLDEDEIRPGNLFAKDLEQALDNCRALALIVSPEAISSGWVKEEYCRILSLAANKRPSVQIVPVIFREAELPGFIQSRKCIDFRDETAYAQNVWKLVWGITGKKPAGVLDLNITTSVSTRIFFILCKFCSDELKWLLLKQNQKQQIFDIGIANSWKFWNGRSDAEMKLKSLQTKSRLEFCQKFREHMIRYDEEFDRSNFDGVNIAVTELAFPRNYYTWNTEDRKGVVVGIKSLEYLFNEPLTMNKIIIRVIQRMLVYSLGIGGLNVHEDTRGCLFDLTRELKDLQFSVDKVMICGECENNILQEKGQKFLNDIVEWVGDSFN